MFFRLTNTFPDFVLISISALNSEIQTHKKIIFTVSFVKILKIYF
jgi:hypothetical protein